MEIPKIYEPAQAENKWYQYWLDNHFFRSVPDEREPYTIVIPPPNVTGVLHMGHMLNNTIQDVLIRRARMQGKNACWVPGTDHASIATETKVVNLLKEKGINKKDLSREDFLKHAFEWKEKYGGIILDQLKKLGASCDWERTRFTMEDDLSDAVTKVFVDLFNKGQIYRGVRMVNWDPQGQTALSDEEVNHKEVNSKLYYVGYPIIEESEAGNITDELIKSKLESGQSITIATTRPETILADTGVCVHPDDERYKSLVGKKALIPFVNRLVPIITDDYIDPEFGTGCLKVTPAHDINDYNLGLKHGLAVIDCLNPDGTISEAGKLYVGMDRFAVRKQISADLQAAGFQTKTQDIVNKVGTSERTGAVIEPRLSMQWFLKMDQISKPALDAVLNGEVKLIPEKFINTYRHWMENVHDWCISRQLWWGQQIPAYYLPDGTFVVAETADEALRIARSKTGNEKLEIKDLRQDEDVVDTWFSSWLWPISVFDGFKDPENADIKYYYPTNDLVTGPDILFFWIARMIIAGYEWRGEKPFSNVYLTGIVRDKLGRKMSKQLGNSPDPLELIGKYGADGVRVGLLLCAPAGNDLPFDENLCEQGRNFSNKVWNAFRLVKGWEINDAPQPETAKHAINWFKAHMANELNSINDHFSKYRLSDALMAIYKLVWDDFCAWYLEIVKPAFIDGKGLPIDRKTYDETIAIFEQLLSVMHPFMPFITEEIWHLVSERAAKDCIIVAKWPVYKYEQFVMDNVRIVSDFEQIKETVTAVRNLRSSKGLSPKEALALQVKNGDNTGFMQRYADVVNKLANISEISFIDNKPEGAFSFMVKTTEFFVPVSANVDLESEKERLAKDLEYTKGFLKSVMSKLNNEKFVNNAKPEIIDNERRKQADAESKIKAIEEQLQALV